ncbi:MetQ/NlpA family lipoprotein [Xenorhabdus japonica]|uniref:Lipoprotein n=1 Tax=Xenorhabdus japonica TaxID=53341 RepID=A0A1I4Z745_9GAMM|nr:MetQ/NlpA family lipoprotein [Xenorhabdus japonica]SFN46101.1 D-methionine transport system substrate-binding protein [Xenorhabdus japonica]
MSIKLKSIAAIGALLGTLILAGCGQEQRDPNHIRVGVIAGPELKVAEVAKQVAKDKYGLDVELTAFNDYVLPNESLSKGDIDVNVFQNKPFLDQHVKERNYKLAIVGNSFIFPMAAYSKKIKSLDELQNGYQIAIPNDPTNLGRALLLLQKQGLITLKEGVDLQPTILDITSNPKHLDIVQLEAPQLPRSLDDQKIAFAIINNTYAGQIGLTPEQDGLFVEEKNSPYVNIIVSRENNKDAENVKKFVKAYQSPEVEKEANKVFRGGAIKGW